MPSVEATPLSAAPLQPLDPQIQVRLNLQRTVATFISRVDPTGKPKKPFGQECLSSLGETVQEGAYTGTGTGPDSFACETFATGLLG